MVVYKYTNKINGKVYIGITSKKVEERNKEHLIQARDGNSYFHRSLRKYGVKNFTLEVIDHAKDIEELYKKEQYYIKKYNSFAGIPNSNGYNLTRGGEGALGLRHSEDTKRKLSKARIGKYKGKDNPNYGKPMSEENKRKISKMKKGLHAGRNNPNYGKRMSKENREKLSRERKGGLHHRAKKVICITTGEVFDYVRQVYDVYGVASTNVSACCKGRIKHAGKHPITGEKLVWRYYNDEHSD